MERGFAEPLSSALHCTVLVDDCTGTGNYSLLMAERRWTLSDKTTMNTPMNTSNKLRLRCSISGGLEELAEREARQQIKDAEIVWITRGKSGSQLEIQCPPTSIPTVMKLRFVEYVFMELGGKTVSVAEKNKTDLLQQIKDSTATILQVEQLDACINLWRTAQTLLSDRRDLGLETIPGILIPTPQLKDEDRDSSVELLEQREEGIVDAFIVNTIYTKAKVAKAVVDTFRELVKTHSSELSLEEAGVLWLDAGAGSGALLRHLPPKNRIGIDIQPSAHPGVYQMDFLSVTKTWLLDKALLLQSRDTNENQAHSRCLCVISNPPFAENSRGDYSAIVKFINHAIELDATYIGLIVPDKFARQRVWQSLGMHPRARLLARCVLPNDSFYDPSNRSCRDMSSLFLFFRLDESPGGDIDGAVQVKIHDLQLNAPRIRIEGNRSKGDFPWLSTAELREAVTCGLQSTGVDLNASNTTSLTISAELKALDDTNTARVKLFALLNPKQPLSLANCVSRNIPEHSLGWLSSSAKPPIAFAMCNLAMSNAKSLQLLITEVTTASSKSSNHDDNDKRGALVVNAMCGEGTIEIESQDCQMPHSFFMIAGDKNEAAVKGTAARLASLHNRRGAQQGRTRRPLVDLVIWDAQRLPLRSGIADVFLADLPFGGSKKKSHQEPCLSGVALDNSLDYKRVMAQAARVIKCSGRAALLSADTKALSHVAIQFNGFWSVLWRNNLNLGGLAAKLFLMKRHQQCSKDLSVWITSGTDIVDLSDALKRTAIDVCAGFRLDDLLEMQQCDSFCESPTSLILDVELISTFFNKEKSMRSHCYRVWFDTCMSNLQAKQLEKIIRAKIEENPPEGMQLR